MASFELGPESKKAIRKIEQFSSGLLDDQECNALKNEVAAHLDASIQARLEMHQSPCEADREAVRSFGSIWKLVSSVYRMQAKPVKLSLPAQDAVTITGAFLSLPVTLLFLEYAPDRWPWLALFAGLACFGVVPYLSRGWSRRNYAVALPVHVAALAAYLVVGTGIAPSGDLLLPKDTLRDFVPKLEAQKQKVADRESRVQSQADAFARNPVPGRAAVFVSGPNGAYEDWRNYSTTEETSRAWQIARERAPSFYEAQRRRIDRGIQKTRMGLDAPPIAKLRIVWPWLIYAAAIITLWVWYGGFLGLTAGMIRNLKKRRRVT